MAKVKLWSGVAVAVQSTLATALTITAVTKANPGVATFTGTQPAAGSYVVVTANGMNGINNRVFRVGSPTATTFQLVGEDTTLYDTFTDGTAQVITFGTNLNSATGLSVSGGNFNFVDTTTIHEFIATQVPGIASAATYSMELLWDPSDAAQVAFKRISNNKTLSAIRFTWPDGTVLVFNGYIGYVGLPAGNAQEKVTANCSFTMYGSPTIYGV